ncbi:hypothetical protein ACFQNE_14855 [Gordonia phosphorivorans]|uniref:Uncharacterized protein n=1 Tax=Gordonia phosphorivorans TaxID=1056982 RepID=A0ABV6HCQ0_9ACTN
MSSKPADDHSSSASDSAEQWRRRRRLDEIFGDVVPETMADAGESAHTDRGRGWYEQNKPPHHG